MPKPASSEYPGTELDVLAGAVNYHRWILAAFRPYLGTAVAEVGAGIGSVSTLLLESPFERLIAFEPSANLFPLLAGNLKSEKRARVVNDVFRPDYLPGGVDAILYINVLEHIERDLDELINARLALRPGGHLLVFVPALSWLYSDFDKHVGHFRRYSKRGLTNLARDAGFEVLKARYFDIAGIVPWYVSFVLLHGGPRPGSVALYDRLVVPPMRMLEAILPPPLGKNVLLIARKMPGDEATASYGEASKKDAAE
jgi:SAM-dependent methyltransferase